MSSLSDGELLAHFQAGDEFALEALFERYEQGLFHFLLGMLRDHHQAEDALQETFIKALEHIPSVRAESLKSWLYTVAYRQAMLTKRKQKRRAEQPEDAALGFAATELAPDDQVLRAEQVQQVRRLLDQLPPLQRDVIRARIYEGKPFRQIAQDQDCPLNTALARMHEGLKRLRTLWEQQHARSAAPGSD
ncbi:RNA polymerase sigma factor [Tuwongella immobilis]|uniref:RNA polymerase sigma-70 region 2 domain-containing protein n=1 Tax=Tuwongella immobilis TaxID=692036 RepID=A0A6C2YQB4_9BACT|nr:RNA polymerase sigma factor [Tuwongella immobilis]VIP03584.1 rna polymerase subunit sigma-24 : Sigma-70 region 2 OS=Planctomyces maris DSM 8797 GN=PM8797T_29313 PE=4 SV=1: Sigma70_r2: Sigma70_r4_2 [Tuwongella immobilis]VTS04536.1 rna polymerase subunit sigma-24 : Sigma-70 region 2 OS=Planctomyces maris DSM 8797 GN=PM8797T_29313 PE=4 SV=1: Sigma70_r2: Sigma70_r4_2 [Tuwongella immobilis]